MIQRFPLIILAGGKGTRLRSIESRRPKPMILVDGKPFLHWLVDHYVKQGFRELILSVGHLAEVIENYSWKKEFPQIQVKCFREASPLGTGGAVGEIKRAGLLEKADGAWIANGDTLISASLPEISDSFRSHGLLCLLHPHNAFDAKPNVWVNKDSILSVSEEVSVPNAQGYLDTGAVFLKMSALSSAVEKLKGKTVFSIHELLDFSIAEGKVECRVLEGTFYDIGTPERFKRFEKFLASRPSE